MRITSVKTHVVHCPIPDDQRVRSGAGLKLARQAAFVEIETDESLSGFGPCSFGSASLDLRAVASLMDNAMAPALIGEDPRRVSYLWEKIYFGSIVRVHGHRGLGVALISAIDIALWDIKGKEAGKPVYELLGGPCRSAVPCYAHAVGKTLEALADDIRHYMEDGWPVIRCQLGQYGGGGFIDVGSPEAKLPKNAWPREKIFDDELYITNTVKMFDYLREQLGFGVKFTHDVHEHLRPHNAVALAKLLEPHRLFFLEDVLPPEHIAYYRQIRQQCTTPQAMGELFVNVQEYLPLISERLIDYIRCRVSKVGGITQAQKIAHLAEFFGVNTAWQEGGNTDPVNITAALHLDMASWSFGIQEENWFTPEELEAFPGHPVLENGYMYLSGQPGLGIDIDEEKARKLVNPELAARPRYVAEDRRADGSVVRP
jgi:mannonate dehydratase